MITLFTGATGNGYRASIMLEELGLPYVAKAVDFSPDVPRPAELLAASPLGKIPAIIDPEGPDGEPVAIAETLAIAGYLVEKTGKLAPATAAGRARALQWSAIVVSGFGAAFSGIFFARAIDAQSHAGLIAKHFADIDRHFRAMDTALAASTYLADDAFSYADVLAAPLMTTGKVFGVDFAAYPNVRRWGDAVFARPGVQRGMAVKG
jgi:GST-like protein